MSCAESGSTVEVLVDARHVILESLLHLPDKSPVKIAVQEEFPKRAKLLAMRVSLANTLHSQDSRAARLALRVIFQHLVLLLALLAIEVNTPRVTLSLAFHATLESTLSSWERRVATTALLVDSRTQEDKPPVSLVPRVTTTTSPERHVVCLAILARAPTIRLGSISALNALEELTVPFKPVPAACHVLVALTPTLPDSRAVLCAFLEPFPSFLPS